MILSAYKAVIEGEPNPQVDKYDIFMAISSEAQRVNSLSMKVDMFNYSYNPLRLKAEHYYLVDTDDKKYPASKSSTIKPEILDQDHETQIALVFPKPRNQIKKLVYENGDHYSEKHFF